MTTHKPHKNRIRGALGISLLRLSAMLPLRMVHLLGHILGLLTYLFSASLRHISQRNIETCLPEIETAHQHQLVKQSLVETGKTALEAGPMWLWPMDKIEQLVVHVEGEHYLREAFAAQQGVVLAFPHLGCWEILSLYCAARYPMTTLYRAPRVTQLDSIMRHGRERSGATLVPADNHGVKALFKTLSEGKMIGILPDQEPAEGKGVFAPFFGIPAYSMPLLSRMVQKTGAKVVVGFAQRLEKGRGYQLVFKPVEAELAEKDIETSMLALNQVIEQCIREVPAQYQWCYKRFNTRPSGDKSFYD